MDSKEVGLRIGFYRQKRNMTQYALAYKAGVSPTYIYQLERGTKSPTVEYLGYICQALDLTLEEFFKPIDDVKTADFIDGLTTEQRKLLNEFFTSL